MDVVIHREKECVFSILTSAYLGGDQNLPCVFLILFYFAVSHVSQLKHEQHEIHTQIACVFSRTLPLETPKALTGCGD